MKSACFEVELQALNPKLSRMHLQKQKMMFYKLLQNNF